MLGVGLPSPLKPILEDHIEGVAAMAGGGESIEKTHTLLRGQLNIDL